MAQQTVNPQQVLSAWRTLPIDHRQVLFECCFRAVSVAEAAETLGVPAATVKYRAYYALRALRDAIDAIEGIASEPRTADQSVNVEMYGALSGDGRAGGACLPTRSRWPMN